MRRLSILIVVTLAGLTVAARQSPSQRVERDDAASPRDNGIRLEDPASWRRVGIDPAEARRWVDAGIPFAEWANQWKGEGFGPADAGVWAANRVNVYTAADFRTAGFSIRESTTWIEHGVRSALRAKEFRDRGFSPADAREWWQLEFYPEEAAEWSTGGFTASQALTWRYGQKEFIYSSNGFRGFSRAVYSLEWAAEWRGAGFSPEQARAAGWYGLRFAEVMEWAKNGFDFDAMTAWRDAGFRPVDAAAERAAGLDPVEAEERRRTASDSRLESTATIHADIVLKPDATIDVAETIVVTQGAGESEPCFSRPLPTTVMLRRSISSYQRGWPSYTMTSVMRNHAPVSYSVDEDRADDLTVCVNEPQAPAPGDTRTFTLGYTTDERVIGLHDYDRFYFTVKGLLPMRVQRASATVHLPKGANTVRADGFAGPDHRKYFTAEVTETSDGDVIEFAATRPLTRDMVFDVAIDLPQGHVQASLWRRTRHFDRRIGRVLSSLAFVGAGWVLALAYFIWAWWRVGRDPQKGAVVSIYEPPENASPALVRYVAVKRRVDDVTVAATLVRLAHSGALRIVEREGRYTLEKTGRGAEGCVAHEIEFLEALCADTSTLVLGTNHARVRMQTARAGLRKALRSAAAAYFAANTRYVRPGAIVSIAGAILGLTAVNLSEMRNVYAYPLFVAGLQVVLVVPFRWLIKAPTARGRKFRDDIEGFRRVLDANFRGTGETLATASGGAPPALAAHLPYAIALGIDADRAMILDRRLAWFTGRSGGFSGSDFTASLRKLTPRTVHP